MSTFEEFQSAVRAQARIHIEADLYWRTNRWEPEPPVTSVRRHYAAFEEAEATLHRWGFTWHAAGLIWSNGDERAVIKQTGERWKIDYWRYD